MNANNNSLNNQANLPIQRNLLDALFNQMTVKEEIIIKSEKHDINVGDINIIYHTEDDAEGRIIKFSNVAEAFLLAIEQETGADNIIRRSKAFTKNMADILEKVQMYEHTWQIHADYDLRDESKISTLGWYACMIRLQVRLVNVLNNGLTNYSSNVDHMGKIADRLRSSDALLQKYKIHARSRYPQYKVLNIV